MLCFRDLGVFVFDLGCFVFKIWVLRSSFSSASFSKLPSDSQGLVDFAIGLVNFVVNLPDAQVRFFLGNCITEEL